MAYPLIFYDGVCGLCNRFVRFVLRHDRRGVFRFASLQSPLAARILAAHTTNSGMLDALFVVRDFAPEKSGNLSQTALLSRSDAVLFVLHKLGGVCRAAAVGLRLVPRFVRDWAYRQVAANRYRIFGRSEVCAIPDPSARSRFLDL
jgi:predicted DCC family thiol-disulfide oxidoreductase YuxK